MDRDIALELVDVMTDIKTAIQTIANGGTPPEAAADATTNVVGDSRSVETPEEPAEEPVTKATKTTKKGVNENG